MHWPIRTLRESRVGGAEEPAAFFGSDPSRTSAGGLSHLSADVPGVIELYLAGLSTEHPREVAVVLRAV